MRRSTPQKPKRLATRSNVRRYFVGLCAALAAGFLISVANFILQIGTRTEASAGRCAAVHDKISGARSFEAPRIVFIGGSGVHWGINAQRAGRAIGRAGVNFGLFAALGADMILWNARDVLRPGDIAVLVLEYDIYTPQKTSAEALSFALDCRGDFFAHVSRWELARLMLATEFQRMAKVWTYRPTQAAGPSMTDEHGDAPTDPVRVRALTKEQRERLALYRPINFTFQQSGVAARAIRDFVRFARDNNITVVATWPNTIAFDAYASNPAFEQIRTFYDSLAVPVLGQPTDAMLPVSLFLDTIYHLNVDGISHRTTKLIADLKPVLGKP